MTLIADVLMTAGALGAAFYCMILSRRLRRLSNLDDGMGAAIAVLSQQVEQMTRALESTRAAASGSAEDLETRIARAEQAGRRLELLMAALNDRPRAKPDQPVVTSAQGLGEAPDKGSEGRFVSRRASLLASEDVL